MSKEDRLVKKCLHAHKKAEALRSEIARIERSNRTWLKSYSDIRVDSRRMWRLSKKLVRAEADVSFLKYKLKDKYDILVSYVKK